MLDRKTFAEQIAILNAYYVNFRLDIENELVLKVWFESVKQFEPNVFKLLVKDYMFNNVYAPQSPASLIEHFRNAMIKNEKSAESALDLVLEKRRNNMRVRKYSATHLIEHFNKEGEVAIANTVMRMKTTFDDNLPDDMTWVRKEFKEIYEQEIRKVVNTKFGTNALQNVKIKLLGGKNE